VKVAAILWTTSKPLELLDVCVMQIETEEEMLHANNAKKREVMVPERDVPSRPKRPVPATDVKLSQMQPSLLSSVYEYEADVISSRSRRSNKENVSRPTKLRVCGHAVFCMILISCILLCSVSLWLTSARFL